MPAPMNNDMADGLVITTMNGKRYTTLEEILIRTYGNQTKAGRILNIDRNTVTPLEPCLTIGLTSCLSKLTLMAMTLTNYFGDWHEQPNKQIP